MIILSLIVWFLLPVIAPSSLLAQVADIPFLSILLAKRKLSFARYGAFLCLWNCPFDIQTGVLILPLIRLLSIDISQLLIKSVFIEPLPRACLTSLLLNVISWCLACFIMPVCVPCSFASAPVWSWKHFVLSSLLSVLLTLFVGSLKSIPKLLSRKVTDV